MIEVVCVVVCLSLPGASRLIVFGNENNLHFETPPFSPTLSSRPEPEQMRRRSGEILGHRNLEHLF
jgi:hypothetical protein